MEHKTLYIGGGIAAALLIGFVIVKKSHANAQDTAQQSTPVYADAGFMSSLAPSSGGISSPSDTSSSGSAANSGGGFDISTLLGTLITSQGKTASESTQASSGNMDAAILSTISPRNGSATVSHSASGTTVSVAPAGDLYDQALTELYQKEFNRAPDAGGMSFWKNAMMNQGVSIVHVQDEFEHSPEYVKLHPELAK